MLRRFIIFIFLFINVASFAQKQLRYDTASIEVRTFSDSSINIYKADKAFRYDKITEPPANWWDRFWAWFWYKVDEIFSTPQGEKTLLILFILFGIAAIIFLIRKTTGMNKTGLFSRRSKDAKGYIIGEENIHTISFEDEINKAVTEANYRLAVRLLYLQHLKFLTDKKYINWEKNKTNYDYVKEMKTHPLYALFANITNSFEYAWYGNKTVTREWFSEIKESFQQFK